MTTKSRVINSKYFEYKKLGAIGTFIGYTDKLKPSLFYGKPEKENVIWLQSKETNKMSKWNLDLSSILIDDETNEIISWTYLLDDKYAKKFPELIGKQILIIFNRQPDKKVYKMEIERFQKVYLNIKASSKEEAWDKVLKMWQKNKIKFDDTRDDLRCVNFDDL